MQSVWGEAPCYVEGHRTPQSILSPLQGLIHTHAMSHL